MARGHAWWWGTHGGGACVMGEACITGQVCMAGGMGGGGMYDRGNM